MLTKRIIPCLDVKEGKVVKGINFVDFREVGDPVEMGVAYSREGADELVYLDISASLEGRKTFTGQVSRIAERIDIPFTVGGGISSYDDAARLIDAGADKISINTAAVLDPTLITRIASKYGSRFVVVAIDARQDAAGKQLWQVTTHGGMVTTDKELFFWVREVQERGAGEILFTSMDHDGTRNGYAVDVYARLADEITIPVIASGGAGNVQHILDVLTRGKAAAALAASVFHYGEIRIRDLKRQLADAGVPVRLDAPSSNEVI